MGVGPSKSASNSSRKQAKNTPSISDESHLYLQQSWRFVPRSKNKPRYGTTEIRDHEDSCSISSYRQEVAPRLTEPDTKLFDRQWPTGAHKSAGLFQKFHEPLPSHGSPMIAGNAASRFAPFVATSAATLSAPLKAVAHRPHRHRRRYATSSSSNSSCDTHSPSVVPVPGLYKSTSSPPITPTAPSQQNKPTNSSEGDCLGSMVSFDSDDEDINSPSPIPPDNFAPNTSALQNRQRAMQYASTSCPTEEDVSDVNSYTSLEPTVTQNLHIDQQPPQAPAPNNQPPQFSSKFLNNLLRRRQQEEMALSADANETKRRPKTNEENSFDDSLVPSVSFKNKKQQSDWLLHQQRKVLEKPSAHSAYINSKPHSGGGDQIHQNLQKYAVNRTAAKSEFPNEHQFVFPHENAPRAPPAKMGSKIRICNNESATKNDRKNTEEQKQNRNPSNCDWDCGDARSANGGEDHRLQASPEEILECGDEDSFDESHDSKNQKSEQVIAPWSLEEQQEFFDQPVRAAYGNRVPSERPPSSQRQQPPQPQHPPATSPVEEAMPPDAIKMVLVNGRYDELKRKPLPPSPNRAFCYKFWVEPTAENVKAFHNPADRRIESIGRLSSCRIRLTNETKIGTSGDRQRQVVIYAPNIRALEKCCSLFDDKFPSFYAAGGLKRDSAESAMRNS